MPRPHTHKCDRCTKPFPCDGDLENNYDGFPEGLENNYDGFPEVICRAFHVFAQQTCEACREAVKEGEAE